MLHNALIYGGRLSSAIARASGVEMEGDAAGRISETLHPVFDLWGRDLEEWSYLRNERLGSSGAVTSPAVVAEFSMNALLNPTGSNHLVIVQRWRSFDTGANRLLGIATEAQVATLATSANGRLRDRRFNIANNPTVCVIRQGSDPAGVGQDLDILGSAQIDYIGLPFILSPGEAAVERRDVVNTALTSVFHWRERPLLPGERASQS